jgi:hypothetical protein
VFRPDLTFVPAARFGPAVGDATGRSLVHAGLTAADRKQVARWLELEEEEQQIAAVTQDPDERRSHLQKASKYRRKAGALLCMPISRH